MTGARAIVAHILALGTVPAGDLEAELRARGVVPVDLTRRRRARRTSKVSPWAAAHMRPRGENRG
jgi:hypothetical protein